MPWIDHDDTRHLKIDQFRRRFLALQLHADARGIEGDRWQIDAHGRMTGIVYSAGRLFLADTDEPDGGKIDRCFEAVAVLARCLRPVSPEFWAARLLTFIHRTHEQWGHRPSHRFPCMVVVGPTVAPDPDPQFAMRDAVDRRLSFDHRVLVRNRLWLG